MPDLTIERLQLFLLVVMPGIIAIKVYDLFYPPEKRDFGSSLMEAAAYGLINLAVWIVPLFYINQKEWIENHPFWYAGCSILFLVVSPILLALLTAKVRNFKWVAKHLGYPTRTAWDEFFRRRQECWILFYLKNGMMVGGYFGEHSYATTYPQPPEIYVEEVYRVDDVGEFVEIVEGTKGMLIRSADCERVEFLAVKEKTSGQQ